MRRAGPRVASIALVALASASCELAEITVAPTEPVLVVDALLQLVEDDEARILVVLHRTLGSSSADVTGATVTLRFEDGEFLQVPERMDDGPCISTGPPDGAGTCYQIAVSGLRFEAGARIDLDVRTAEGERLEGFTTVPGPFDWVRPTEGDGPGSPVCVQPPWTPLPLEWTRSEGAWAYLAEVEIAGIRNALALEGIEILEDPLYLLGLSVSAGDTTITLPTEFGLFDRFDLDRDVAVALQRGLPVRTLSTVTVAAVDRNFVNWVRGGNFNPSGTVRIPSVRGDGTGFFGSSRVRFTGVFVPPPGPSLDLPGC